MTKKTILALRSLMTESMEDLEKRFHVIRLNKEEDPETVLQEHRNNIVGIVTSPFAPVGRRLMEALPNLEIICQNGIGVDSIDLDAAKERGVAVTNTPDLVTNDTADTAVALVLGVARRTVEADVYVRLHKWLEGPMGIGTTLANKTAGIVGMGRVGQAIARRLKASEMNVVYHGPREKPDVSYMYYSDVTAMARACDFLVLSCPGGEKTRHMVDIGVLKALGPQGYLVNVARGSVVNEEDLQIALRNEYIAGAGLDVFENEPYVPEALLTMDNVVLFPHIGARTHETLGAMSRLVVDNLRAHFEGEELKTEVKV